MIRYEVINHVNKYLHKVVCPWNVVTEYLISHSCRGNHVMQCIFVSLLLNSVFEKVSVFTIPMPTLKEEILQG